MTYEDKEKLVKFLANQLLKEVTFEQTLELVKYQALKQSTGVFEKMTDSEKYSLLENIQKSESENG